jgi:hypothetical protein
VQILGKYIYSQKRWFGGSVLDSSGSGWGHVAGYCEHESGTSD